MTKTIVRKGKNIAVPPGMSWIEVDAAIKKQAGDQLEYADYSMTFPYTLHEGGYALHKALIEIYGSALGGGRKINLPNQDGGAIEVPWGSFEVPNVEGYFGSSYSVDNGRYIFELEAHIQVGNKPHFDRLVAKITEILQTNDMYRRNSLEVAFTDEGGSTLRIPSIKFLNLGEAFRPIYRSTIERQIDISIMPWLVNPDLIKSKLGTLKRGFLFAGSPGTGKTALVRYLASVAIQNGYTPIMTTSRDFIHALRFAKQYQPAFVIVEDLEKAIGLERDDKANELLIEMDGISSKNSDIVVAATTNNIHLISKVMLRAKRFDVILSIENPDGTTALRLVEMYAKGAMSSDSFGDVQHHLDGFSPAGIAEITNRALVQAMIEGDGQITPEILAEASIQFMTERQLIDEQSDSHGQHQKLVAELGASIGHGIGQVLNGSSFSRNGKDSQHTAMAQR